MSSNIKKVICVTDNFPNGQRITAARIVYDAEIDAEKLTKDAFSAEKRTITAVSAEGNEVTLSFDPEEKEGYIFHLPDFSQPLKKGPGGPGGPKGPGGPGGMNHGVGLSPVEITVKQTGDIYAADGAIIAGSDEAIKSSETDEAVIKDFAVGTFEGIDYNFYSPKNIEEGKVYPLVIFIPDGGSTGKDVKITLAQGNGAVTWAEPEWQAKHPCYVLAPQPNGTFRTTDDVAERATPKLFVMKALIDYIIDTNAIDRKRVYCTGQSGGGMCFAEMNIQYPNFFASTMFVACQWNAERFAEACNHKRFWILVSNGDAKAFPGWNAMTDALEKKGAKIGRYVWNAKLPHEELEELAKAAANDENDIHYTVFESSSVVPSDRIENPMNNHHCTWPVAYSIDAVKEWIFSQKLD